MHHARNPEYIDRNSAGVLIMWEKLFGTFGEEDARVHCEYGIVGQIHSHDPIRLTFPEWAAMFRDAARASGPRAALGELFCPPERARSHRGSVQDAG